MKLKKEVTEKYNLVDVMPGKHQFAGYGDIDLTTLTLSDADALFNIGFPYLQLKKKVAAK